MGVGKPVAGSKENFRYAEVPTSAPDRDLTIGQMISVSRIHPDHPMAATVRKISDDEILLELLRPASERAFEPADTVRLKSWNRQEAFYFDSTVLRIFGSAHQHLVISRAKTGIVLQRRKSYRIHGPVPFAFTIIQAAEPHLSGHTITRAVAKDLTVGGLAFETRLPLEKGDKLELDLHLPPNQRVKAVAWVLRSSTAAEDDSLHTVALKFLQLDARAQNCLLLFLAQTDPEGKRGDVFWVG